MKILNIDNYISERIKIKPVTNAEWGKTQDEIKLKFYNHTLQQGDIVYFRMHQNIPYMVILEESLYKKVMLISSLRSYDCTKGVFLLKSIDSCSPTFMTLSDYDASLKNIRNNINNYNWDIVKVYRGHLDAILPKDMNDIIVLDNLNKLVKNFKLVFEDGKWL